MLSRSRAGKAAEEFEPRHECACIHPQVQPAPRFWQSKASSATPPITGSTSWASHVSNLATAHVAALRHLNASHPSLILNLGTGKATSIRSVITAVERVTGRLVPLVHAARRPRDPPVLVADASLAHEVIGFDPRFSDIETIVATAWQARARDHFPRPG